MASFWLGAFETRIRDANVANPVWQPGQNVQAKLSGECISGSSYCKPETVLASDPIENPNNKSFKKEISTSAKGCW